VPAPFVLVDESLDGLGPGDPVSLPDDEIRHLVTVLRLRDGAPLEVADGRGLHADGLLAEGTATLTASPSRQERATPSLEVLQALPKGRKIDEVVRVLTELGVDAVTLVAGERSVSRPAADRVGALRERLAAVARAAAQQSRRAHLPVIHGPVETTAITASEGRALLLADPPPADGVRSFAAAAADVRRAAAVAVLIGPEGGFSPAEIDHLCAQGAIRVGMGPVVLRTEHAGAAAVAALSALLGRW
jgi:16S rRNA (uracil1498-N3)-methyltransferase